MTAGGRVTLLTGAGPAAIAVLRLCGTAVTSFIHAHVRSRVGLAQLDPGGVQRATLLDADGAELDDILLSVHATTPLLDIRLHLHGSPGIVARCLELAGRQGFERCDLPGSIHLWPAGDALDAATAELLPSILTERGVLWVLEQTAALRRSLDALSATTDPDAARKQAAALIAGLPRVAWFQRPLHVPLVGLPNAGKSTLANALADRAVSLTSAQPGTTRDWVEVPGEIAGLPVCWQDTAGVRDTGDALEASAVSLTRELIGQADVVALVIDRSAPADLPTLRALAEAAADRPLVIVRTKADLPAATPLLAGADFGRPDAVAVDVSGTTGVGVQAPAAAAGETPTPSAWAPDVGLNPLGAAVLAAAGRDPSSLGALGVLTANQAAALNAACATLPEMSRFRQIIADIIGRPLT